ncbi:MAG: hypothetical protein M5T52_16245 [Ignavibacteriaceae bacterium]|nr:hypothetical protein [Ignavibacteriaceae bacterium]
MTLIERIESIKREERPSIDSQSKTENNEKQSTRKNKFTFASKDYTNKFFDFLKKKKGLLIFSSVVILLIYYFAQSNNSTEPEKTLYNYELDKQNNSSEENNSNSINIENNRNNYSPSNIERETYSSTPEEKPLDNQKVKDFSNIPEKYIPNGKIFLKNKRYFTGLGELTIKNGTNNDAVVKLVPITINKSALTLYVRRNSDFTIKKIKDGNYKLYFVVGRHYDEDSLIFLQDCSFSVFEKGLPFTTNEFQLKDRIEREYSVSEITLHPVIGGTARTDAITKKDFYPYRNIKLEVL